jgi:hypothetical protein
LPLCILLECCPALCQRHGAHYFSANRQPCMKLCSDWHRLQCNRLQPFLDDGGAPLDND